VKFILFVVGSIIAAKPVCEKTKISLLRISSLRFFFVSPPNTL
jgi:hypothetical protein